MSLSLTCKRIRQSPATPSRPCFSGGGSPKKQEARQPSKQAPSWGLPLRGSPSIVSLRELRSRLNFSSDTPPARAKRHPLRKNGQKRLGVAGEKHGENNFTDFNVAYRRTYQRTSAAASAALSEHGCNRNPGLNQSASWKAALPANNVYEMCI